METRTERIKFWLTDKELKRIERQAKKMRMNRSEYIRNLINNCKLVRAPNIDYEKWYSEFKALGDEFNSYLKGFNQTGVFNEKKADEVCFKILDLEKQLSAELTEKLELEIQKAKGGLNAKRKTLCSRKNDAYGEETFS